MTRLEDFCGYLASKTSTLQLQCPNVSLCGEDIIRFVSDYEKQEGVAITIVKNPTDTTEI